MPEETNAAPPNDPVARTPDGTLIDQTPNSTSTTETPPTDPKAATGAPETYADFTAPEGITLDKEAITAATAFFKEQGFTQEQAQAIVNQTSKREADLVKRANDAYASTRREWREAVMKEFGENNFNNNIRPAIGRALETLDPALRQEFATAMDVTGVGDNPAFVKAFYQLAQKVNEGRPVAGAPTTTAKPANPGLAGSMFPNSTTAPQGG